MSGESFGVHSMASCEHRTKAAFRCTEACECICHAHTTHHIFDVDVDAYGALYTFDGYRFVDQEGNAKPDGVRIEPWPFSDSPTWRPASSIEEPVRKVALVARARIPGKHPLKYAAWFPCTYEQATTDEIRQVLLKRLRGYNADITDEQVEFEIHDVIPGLDDWSDLEIPDRFDRPRGSFWDRLVAWWIVARGKDIE